MTDGWGEASDLRTADQNSGSLEDQELLDCGPQLRLCLADMFIAILVTFLLRNRHVKHVTATRQTVLTMLAGPRAYMRNGFNILILKVVFRKSNLRKYFRDGLGKYVTADHPSGSVREAGAENSMLPLRGPWVIFTEATVQEETTASPDAA